MLIEMLFHYTFNWYHIADTHRPLKMKNAAFFLKCYGLSLLPALYRFLRRCQFTGFANAHGSWRHLDLPAYNSIMHSRLNNLTLSSGKYVYSAELKGSTTTVEWNDVCISNLPNKFHTFSTAPSLSCAMSKHWKHAMRNRDHQIKKIHW